VVKKVFAVVVEDEPSPSNFAAPRDENDDEEEYNPFSSQTSAFSLQPSAFSLSFYISSYQDALIFNLHCGRLFVSLGTDNLSPDHAGPN
jgi:hypothetical protein